MPSVNQIKFLLNLNGDLNPHMYPV